MTTNQTIDGVPRELLSEWLKALNSRTSVPVAIRKMRNELRALLDADQPAPVAAIQFAGFNVVEDPSVPPGQIRMCDCNQGRVPCNGKCKPTS